MNILELALAFANKGNAGGGQGQGGGFSYNNIANSIMKNYGGGDQQSMTRGMPAAPPNVEAQREDANSAFEDKKGEFDFADSDDEKGKGKARLKVKGEQEEPQQGEPAESRNTPLTPEESVAALKRNPFLDSPETLAETASKNQALRDSHAGFAGANPETVMKNINSFNLLQGLVPANGVGAGAAFPLGGQPEFPAYNIGDIEAAQDEAREKVTELEKTPGVTGNSNSGDGGGNTGTGENSGTQSPARKSQRQEYIDFLGTDEGQAWLALHGGQGFDDATYGYENLRASGDMGAWGDLLGYNPDVAGINSWRGRYGSAGVDLNDIASLEDYLYGSNAISQAAFDAALAGQGDFDVSKFGEGDDFENMAKYMLENSGYGPDLIAALEQSGLDANDFAALAMATGASQGTFNPSDIDVNRILGAAGEGTEVGIGDDFSMQWDAPNRDYQLSDIMNARNLNKNDTTSYGNVTIDDDLLPYMMAYLDSGQPEGKRYGAKKRS